MDGSECDVHQNPVCVCVCVLSLCLLSVCVCVCVCVSLRECECVQAEVFHLHKFIVWLNLRAKGYVIYLW